MATKTAKEQAKSEADQLIEPIDEKLQKLQRQIEDLTHVNEVLLYENQGLRAKLNGIDTIPILYLDDEGEFFPNEIRGMILTALEERPAKTDSKTRQADILKDVIYNNGGCQHITDRKAQKLRSVLKGYKSISNSMRQLLIELGFVISEEDKHYKLTHYDDGRYWATIAESPSDNRTRTNIALTIIKNIL